MTNEDLIRFAVKCGACGLGTRYLKSADPAADASDVWLKCSRADWMLWLAEMAGVPVPRGLVFDLAKVAAEEIAAADLRTLADDVLRLLACDPSRGALADARLALSIGAGECDPAFRVVFAADVFLYGDDLCVAKHAAHDVAFCREHPRSADLVRAAIPWATVEQAIRVVMEGGVW